MNQNYKTVISNIKKIRKSKKVNQDELAEKIGLSRTSVTNIEQGRQAVSLETLFDISLALEVDVKQFFVDVESPLRQVEEEYQLIKDKYERLVRSLNKLTNEFNFLDD